MYTPAPSGRGGGYAGLAAINAGLPVKTPGMAFRASGGAGGDLGLADAIYRHPRLVSPPHLGPGCLFGADRRVSIPGEGVALPPPS